MSRVLIILGNGFSIDLVNKLNLENDINLINLFTLGEYVQWPADDKPPFLSYNHCPNLWTLGAQPNVSSVRANELIQEIITCANMISQIDASVDKIHIKAYRELECYLMSLFIHYTKKANISLRSGIDLDDWGWKQYLIQLKNDLSVSHVDIISLNYDVWLEQLLKEWSIEYSIAAFEEDTKKFRVYKPHGSIGFCSKIRKDKTAYTISYMGKVNLDTDAFKVDYGLMDGLNMTNAMIPPAGDSSRMVFTWAKKQKDLAIEAATKLESGDKLMLCGISYWPVDRSEIDSYLTSVDTAVDAYMINPNPPKDLVAVLMTLFDRFSTFTNSDNLIKI